MSGVDREVYAQWDNDPVGAAATIAQHSEAVSYSECMQDADDRMSQTLASCNRGYERRKISYPDIPLCVFNCKAKKDGPTKVPPKKIEPK